MIPAGTGLAYHEERQRKREETDTEKPELVELSFNTDFTNDQEQQPSEVVEA